jgi:hypothetical protein
LVGVVPFPATPVTANRSEMSNRESVITLLAVVALAAVLLVVNMTVRSVTATPTGQVPAPASSPSALFGLRLSSSV